MKNRMIREIPHNLIHYYLPVILVQTPIYNSLDKFMKNISKFIMDHISGQYIYISIYMYPEQDYVRPYDQENRIF